MSSGAQCASAAWVGTVLQFLALTCLSKLKTITSVVHEHLITRGFGKKQTGAVTDAK